MRDGLTILDRTRMRTETIAGAMVSVMAFMEPERKGWRDEDGCKAEVDTIEAMHGNLKAEMAQALRFIQHHWNEIIVNEMRLQEVETFGISWFQLPAAGESNGAEGGVAVEPKAVFHGWLQARRECLPGGT